MSTKSAEEKRNTDPAMTDYKNELRSVLYDFLGDFKEKRYLSEGNTDEAIAKLEALLSQHSKKRELELYNLYGSPRCDNLHHAKKHQHKALESCPVEKIINDRINQLGGQDE